MRQLLLAAAGALMVTAAGALAGPAKLPDPNKFLFWTPAEQIFGYRNIEKIFPTHNVAKGGHVTALPRGKQIMIAFDDKGRHYTTGSYMQAEHIAGLIVLHHGRIVLERYGLGETPNDRWTSFSVAKSVTSTLVGAAIKDGSIKSLDAPVTDYIAGLKGSAYDGVTIRQLLTMSSGVKWNEDYTDPKSDVNSFAGEPLPANGEDPVVAYMARLPREAAPGTKFVYKTGESDLVGVLVQHAVHKPLADYLSEKIWKPAGMQRDAVWMVDRAGIEIGGCCISMTLRDYARFGLWFSHGGKDVLPAGWTGDATSAQIKSDFAGMDYGYQWWIRPGSYQAIGIFGQNIYVDPKDDLIVVTSSAWPHADADELYELRDTFIGGVKTALRIAH